MLRKAIIIVIALLSSVPAFANVTHSTTGQAPAALHLMSDDEFVTFLGHLDADLIGSQEQLKKMDVKSVSLDPQQSADMARSHEWCLQSLENARKEVQKLSQKQTLKLDLFLLIDLNELARNLDALDQGLLNPVAVSGTGGAHKTVSYARTVLDIDVELAADISTFQHHFLAFTGVVDATLEQADYDATEPQPQK
jgi:hypothetical protein